ncbi:TauD/TfdA family dioxygenase [Aspergillus lucknowensis]|uniref:TauD/TfdA-like domain-containing protein n=1 Tax=Aspergillus lucknowensis TaxID=176173 RepID=A0ABR4LY63_9EURO
MAPALVVPHPPAPINPDEAALNGGLRAHFFADTRDGQTLRSAREKEAKEANGSGSGADYTSVRPKLTFQFSLADYQARSARVALARAEAGEDKDTSLPDGFPQEITGPRAWSGQDLGPEGLARFTIQLSEADVAELEAALAHFKGLPGDNQPEHVSVELFPLPALGPRLVEISRELALGAGITVLKGLEPRRYSAWENVVLFAGVTAYLGDRRGCQDRYGNMLTHLVDMGFKYGCASKLNPTFTPNALPYHNDVCDILCLYVQDTAHNGGESILSPAAAVYNEMAATRPDVIHTLAAKTWVYDKDKEPTTWPTRSLLFPEPTHGPFFCFSRQKVTGSDNYPLSPSVPPMTEAQAEAIDMIHYLGEKHGLTVKLERGDMLLYNNLALLHGRNGFTDVPTVEGEGQKRHVLRLWMRNSELAWKTPPGLERDWFLVYGDSERRAKAHWGIRPEDTDKDRVIGHKLTCS